MAGKKGGKKGGRKQAKTSATASDSDNDHYGGDGDFDPKNPFGDDAMESFHSSRDKILLGSLKNSKRAAHVASDEEVLAFDGSDSSDDDDEYDANKYETAGDGDEAEMAEEDEEDGDERGANDDGDVDDENRTSWGKKKSAYYSANRIKNDEDAQLEEEEANALQAKMLKQLDTNDFGLDAFKLTAGSSSSVLKTSSELEASKLAASVVAQSDQDDDARPSGAELTKIVKNLSKMSKKEKLALLAQESPELFELMRDFKEKLTELESILLPIFEAIKSGQLGGSTAASPASDYIVNKTKLYLMYCSHLSLYFALKARRATIENHPIVKNLLQYRNLCKQIQPIDEKLVGEIAFILDSLRSNRPLRVASKSSSSSSPLKVKKSVKFRDAHSAKLGQSANEDDDSDEEDEKEQQKDALATTTTMSADAEKRAINYQIEKNKGLTPKRNKMYRNPRVRNRVKAHKALVKRKSMAPGVRPQEKRYAGESTGIRSHVVRAVKIK